MLQDWLNELKIEPLLTVNARQQLAITTWFLFSVEVRKGISNVLLGQPLVHGLTCARG
jgi:hypothetical protein